MINGSCHCGAVSFTYPSRPEWLTSCNCSVCRRYSTLWAYAPVNEITLDAADDATIAYVHGDKTLAIHSCKTCGGTTHWIGLNDDESSKMAVNFRMCEPDDYADIRVRQFDGADTWDFLDNEASECLMETERLRLRPVTVDDAALMLAVWNDPAFIRHVTDRGIRTLEQSRDAIRVGAQKLFEDYGYGPYCMSLKSDGSMIGICGLFKRENLEDPDIGFSVLPEYCGKGYASEAAQSVVEYARSALGIAVLTAIVSPKNAPSIGLIKKLGLTFEQMVTMPGDDDAICLYRKVL